MLNKENIIEKIRELKPFLYQEFKVKEVGLFGSYSQNLQNESSDIDLIVELEKPIGWKIFTLEIYLQEVFNRKIDLVTKNALKEQLKDKILNQVVYV
jgi:uncharacterized protein